MQTLQTLVEEAQRALLHRREALRALYRESVAEERALTAAPDPDWDDRAGERKIGLVLEQLSERERRELAEVEAALARIAAGAFGRCEACGGAIGKNRLRAVPEARLCIGCASRR